MDWFHEPLFLVPKLRLGNERISSGGSLESAVVVLTLALTDSIRQKVDSEEPLAKVLKTVAPAKAWGQKTSWSLDSGFCRNDTKRLLQEALKCLFLNSNYGVMSQESISAGFPLFQTVPVHFAPMSHEPRAFMPNIFDQPTIFS